MADLLRRSVLALPLAATAAAASEADAWSFRFPSLEGGEHDLAAWRGRVLLVVNTASFCGHTPQYAALQRLHDRYQGRGLVVFGVPSNDFNQEAASNQQVREFCDAQFGIEFPMAAISHVKGRRRIPSSAGRRRGRMGSRAGTSTNTWWRGTGAACAASARA